jgi:hypothetical protein
MKKIPDLILLSILWLASMGLFIRNLFFWETPNKQPRTRQQVRDSYGALFRYFQRQDLIANGLFGKRSKCHNKQIITCGIDDRALTCGDEICDEYMCWKCKLHCEVSNPSPI